MLEMLEILKITFFFKSKYPSYINLNEYLYCDNSDRENECYRKILPLIKTRIWKR